MFKPGDRVILICPEIYYGVTKTGWKGSFVRQLSPARIEVKWDNEGTLLSVNTEHLHLEALYDSPLYKALS